jgi:outer membrane protein OmpA-like peptidoglycan-associated protein
VRTDTAGKIEAMDARYELLQRGQYERLANPLALKMDRKMPLELYEARNAVQIARASGADQFASETFAKAENSLKQAEAYQARNSGRKPVTMAARVAVQTAEDSRAIAVTRQEEARVALERQAGMAREANLKAESEAEARLRALAEAKSAADQSETARIKGEAEAARIAAQAEADRLKLANDAERTAAQAEAERAAREAAQAEADRTQLAAQEADRLLRKAEAEKAELRAQLLTQLNLVLETRDTARGLIINMPDVLFDTAQYSLRPMARERLAKVAGIILGHPGLMLAAEGHTDSVGGDAYNQTLSEQRAGSVRDYLIQQGMSVMNSAPAKGFGETNPVASNDTAAGRQLNRRVELIVSGEIIGAQIASPDARRQ